MNLLSLINPSLEAIYCSTTLSNHDSIRLKKIVQQLHLAIVKRVLSVIHLVLLSRGQIVEVTVALKFFWSLNKACVSAGSGSTSLRKILTMFHKIFYLHFLIFNIYTIKVETIEILSHQDQAHRTPQALMEVPLVRPKV